MVSLIILPVNSFLVPFLGSLAFVCSLPSLPFDLGKGLWPKAGLPPEGSWQREALTFYGSGYPKLQASSSPGPTAPIAPFTSPIPVLQPSLGFLAPTGVITPHCLWQLNTRACLPSGFHCKN